MTKNKHESMEVLTGPERRRRWSVYYAKPALKNHYQTLDPCNCFNPGVGHTSKFAHYREAADTQAATATTQKASVSSQAPS
ncbi:hypothetical protein OKW49_008121 [Paraburkholderia youngii]